MASPDRPEAINRAAKRRAAKASPKVRSGRIRIGTSGWQYRHWIGPFYPPATPSRNLLPLYARQFDSVEVNNTFYRIPAAATLKAWHDATPEPFVFACKASRYITHMKKLKDPDASLPGFLAAVAELREKLGPLLFQLPPHWRINVARLEDFLAALPSGRRYAFEFRDESWFAPAVYDALAARNAAFCGYHLAGRTSPLILTADFAYLRLHGPGGPYQGSYDDRALAGWAERLSAWSAEGIDGYCYFDNDEAGHAPSDALRLRALLSAPQQPE